MNDTETAWASGLYEGEGSTFLSVRRSNSKKPGRRERRQPQLSLSMADQDAVERFAEWGGMSVYRSKPQQLGYKEKWNARTCKAETVRYLLVKMMPYLMSRRFEQAALVSDYVSDTLEWRNERGSQV